MALDKTKTDPKLGQRVHEHLLSLGVETPTTTRLGVEGGWKKTQIEKSIADVLMHLGLDLEDDSIKETPRRVAKMYVDEIFWGLSPENFPKGTVVDNKFNYDEMLIERAITMNSSCEHHLLPVIGKVVCAYIPKHKVLGLSKFNRIVEYFARRPQLQERLTEQIARTLQFLLETDDVAVYVEGEHMCVKTRGVEDETSNTVSDRLLGAFRNPTTRMEFIHIATAK